MSAIYTVELRGDIRRPLMISALVRRYGRSDPPMAVRLVERSAGGVSFMGSMGLPIGERVQITFALPEGAFSGRMEVIHSAAIDEDTFRVGLKVVD